MPTLKGTEVSLFYVQCFLYLVSSSIMPLFFHITWLDTIYLYVSISMQFGIKLLNLFYINEINFKRHNKVGPIIMRQCTVEAVMLSLQSGLIFHALMSTMHTRMICFVVLFIYFTQMPP